MKPRLGQTVYLLFNGSCILADTVYMMNNHQFMRKDIINTEENSWFWWFYDYGKKWFTDLDEAKNALLSIAHKLDGEEIEIVKPFKYQDYYEARVKQRGVK